MNVLHLLKVYQLKTCIVSVLDMLNKCKGDLLEVKDSRCKTQPFLLESLVYFVEVRPLIYSLYIFQMLLCYQVLVT